ncbi:hypothetical protein IGB42_00167 [Andreprevotia sp. IGB-42]|uniref:hypothetical protein n=1 Tax=Andreprevotia sp. IGB-42 TaxID=2497473 RepID=UPI0013574FE0|nr:hypothetical protein [Andreprevotia sp. IGB-42]KAF0815090.1 hypothetical protein IGB42_00167 [Andreprevotia sp. IGB-42]
MRWISGLLFSALLLAGCATGVAAAPRGLIVRFNVDDARTPAMQALAERHHIKLGTPRELALGAWLYEVDGAAQQAFFTELQQAPGLDYAEWDAVMHTQ